MVSKRFTAGAVATAAALALTVTGLTVPANAGPTTSRTFTVVAEDGVSADAAIAAIRAAGGTVVSRTDDVGLYQVTSDRADFAGRVTAASALVGAAEQRAIGRKPKLDRVAQENLLTQAKQAVKAKGNANGKKLDPLDDKLWGLGMIGADKARKVMPGDKRVTVGVLDTGVDASQPDLAPNFNWALSRNFAPDIADIDGPCEVASCLDPVGTDDGGHGTHVAGTIGAAANGFGLSGVAPNVSLVELKGGQDSGYFFLDPVVNALVYAGKSGIDVVNMSFYVDPWLYNCTANPADSPESQAEQRAIIKAMKRALNFAHNKGVTLVGSLGNNHEDLGAPRTDVVQPGLRRRPVPAPDRQQELLGLPGGGPARDRRVRRRPVRQEGRLLQLRHRADLGRRAGWLVPGRLRHRHLPHRRQHDPLHVPEEGAPGGGLGRRGRQRRRRASRTRCSSSAPTAGECGYYTYLQGTSMASPHVSGRRRADRQQVRARRRAATATAWRRTKVEQHLYRTAAEHACPEPRLQSYTNEGRSAEFDAYCAGSLNFNGFYGYGIVDANAAVRSPLKPNVAP